MCISSSVVVGNLGLIGEDKCRGTMAKESTPTITTTTTPHFCRRRLLWGLVVLGIFYGLIIVDAATMTTTTSVENNGKPISRISFGSCSNQTAPQVRNKQNPFVCLFVSFFLSFCCARIWQSFKTCKKTVSVVQSNSIAEFQELQENCSCDSRVVLWIYPESVVSSCQNYYYFNAFSKTM
jgi:hypothetical protein